MYTERRKIVLINFLFEMTTVKRDVGLSLTMFSTVCATDGGRIDASSSVGD